jgi:hypothetical protein
MTVSLRTDLNDFLFTTVADDANGMHLTMLSVLARSGVDPWHEAAGFAALSREDATQKLVTMLASVPNGPSPGDATASLAARLVAQLHPAPKPLREPVRASTPGRNEEPPRFSFATLPLRVKQTIYLLAALILLGLFYRSLIAGEPAPAAESVQQGEISSSS